mmetsp:Transcript_28557/g.50753  ORF Transcript_28557/g.50753 Transcript_28557/m.50753 type:complete len:779 (+) Transcript_28557:58-2394(+)
MDEDSFEILSSHTDDSRQASRLSNERKKNILENLKRERDKRRETVSRGDHFRLESDDLISRMRLAEEPKEFGLGDSNYRSETISRLVEERKRTSKQQSMESTKAVDTLEKAKQALQNQILQEREIRRQLSQEVVSPRAQITPQRHKEAVRLKQPKEQEADRLTYLYDNYVKSPNPKDTKDKPKTPEAAASQPQKRVVSYRPTSAPPDRSKLLREELRRQADEHLREVCTFKPSITPLPKTKELNYNATIGYISPEKRIQTLAKPKTDTILKREQLKREQEEKQAKECSFKPKTNAYKSKTSTISEMPPNDRLYIDAEQRAQARDRRKREHDEQESAAYSFKPQVEASTSALAQNSRPPIYMRLKEVQKEKNEHMQQLRKEIEKNDPHLTFHPKLNPKSARMAEQRKKFEDVEDTDVVERLLLNAQVNLERKHRKEEFWEREEVERYPFAPQLSVNAEINAGSVGYQGSYQSFMERQQAHLEKTRSKQKLLQSEAESDPHCTFRPNIDKNSEYIVESMPHRIAETSEDKFQRMSKEEHVRREQLKAQIEADYYNKFKFEPKINPISKELGRSSTFNDLAYNKDGRKEKRLLVEAQAAMEELHYSFQPKLVTSRKYANVESDYRQGEEILKTIEQRKLSKEEKLLTIKKEKEYEELKDCRFRPQVKEKTASSNGPVVVNGLSRYLELRDLARRQEEEKREREEKVFMKNVKHDPYHVYTVPRPFQLHPSKKEERLGQLKHELEEKERIECTFKPQTLESKNRAMLSRLLTQDYSRELSVS